MDKLLSQLNPLPSPSLTDILYAINGAGTQEGKRTIQEILNLIQNSVESGTFTLNAAGTVATGGVLTNPGANPILTITTTKQLKLWQGLVWETAATSNNSQGRSDGTIQNSSKPSPTRVDASNCIDTVDGNGWKGLITNISTNSYAITFAKTGAGLAITGQWHGIMG